MNPKDIKIKKLNIFKSPIMGINLIEASAGTGKTFTIIVLYLRLLLGIGSDKNCIKKFLIHEILVVTFTNSAKEELYIRIKNSIQNLYLACIEQKSKDPCSLLLLKEITNRAEAIFILQKAQNNINQASIYTIHGLCQNILQLHTLHLNYNFEEKIIDNENDFYLQATEDFWRHYFYNLPESIIKIVHQEYNEPLSLLKTIKPLLHIKSIIFKPKFIKNETLITYHNKIIKKINNFKQIWLKNHQFILEIINNLDINKKKYNQFNITRWIKNISEWAQSMTEDYHLPEILKYFSKKNIKENTINYISSKNIIFEEVEKIFKKKFSLKNIIIFNAVKNISQIILKEKQKKSFLGFNDLLSILLISIKKEKSLRKLIRRKYPVAFIDEFQDTDIEQYKIFQSIYKKDNKTILFLIGDPKQAIYNFRGADIFSYLYAKSQIKNHYYLDKNWRSSSRMCTSINLLFSQHKNPFLFKKIIFQSIESCSKNLNMNFKIHGIIQSELQFFLQEQPETNIDDYHNWISKQCANQISYWLNCAKTGKAIITTKKGEKILQLNDIAILVRNQKEANIIQKELKKMNISSIYSSQKKNIFQTVEAQELLWILQSILNPTEKNLLQQSISTHIFQQLISLEKIECKNNTSYFFIEKLFEYSSTWEKIGVFNMIRSMILEYQMNCSILENTTNSQKNIRYLHISELLQEQSQNFCKKKSLIRWFQKKIVQKNDALHNEKIRYYNESKSIKIVTIHKSKGLEYPIVWIPFGINFHESKIPIYHNEKNFKTYFNTNFSCKYLKISDQERLAEDLRFLYVALTRSVFHCSIGIACLVKKKINRINNDSHIHKSALGYIIQNGQSMNYEKLLNKLKKLSDNDHIKIQQKIKNIKLNNNKKNIYLISQPNLLNQEIQYNWKLTSFTQLNKENLLSIPISKKIVMKTTQINEKQNLNVHNFPKGRKTGLLMHAMLKNFNAIHQKDDIWFSNFLEKHHFPKKWDKILISWMYNIINTPLMNNKNIVLSNLKKTEYIQEFEFFLPIKKILNSSQLNEIIQFFDPISNISPKIIFNPLTGILKGFIDLVFFWEKKYYILDYKSNWLGKNNNFYSSTCINKEIIKHRYDLQYQIYTLAIHQYLTNKIKKYNYKKDFGGVFYIFLRALGDQDKNNGIFHCIPSYQLIKKIILLFSDKK